MEGMFQILTATFSGFMHLAAGLSVGLTGLAAGYAIGVVGDMVYLISFTGGRTRLTSARVCDHTCCSRGYLLAWF